MSESITEFEFVDEIQRKFDQLYRALAKTNPWVPVPGDDDSMACIYCQRRRAHAQMYEAKSAHAADCCLLYTSPSPRDRQKSRMPSSA